MAYSITLLSIRSLMLATLSPLDTYSKHVSKVYMIYKNAFQ